MPVPADAGAKWSGDLHVHMNYGGLYRNTPAHLAEQARKPRGLVARDAARHAEQHAAVGVRAKRGLGHERR